MDIEDIRRHAIQKLPHLARALLTMQPTATNHELPGWLVADQDWNLYYNPAVLDQLNGTVEEVRVEAVAQLCVECVRLLQDHATRLHDIIPDAQSGQPYGQCVAHVSSQMVATELLRESISFTTEHISLADLSVPQQYLLGPKPSVEHLARKLMDWYPAPPPLQIPATGGEEGEAQSSPTPPRTPEDDLRQLKNRQTQQPGGGSAVDGIPRPWEERSLEPELKPQAGTIERRALQQQVQQATAQAILRGYKAGDDVGQHLVQWAQEQVAQVPILQPRSFQSLLKQFTQTTHGHEVRRFDGRNRRQQQISRTNSTQFCLPRDRAAQAQVLFVLDTSGSMGTLKTKRALLWIARVLRAMRLDSTSCLYGGDTGAYVILPRITLAAVRNLSIDGDGGTDMPECIETALAQRLIDTHGEAPNLIVCVTDGYTGWEFPRPLSIPLVIALANCIENSTGILAIEHYYQGLCDSGYVPPSWAHLSLIECNQGEAYARGQTN